MRILIVTDAWHPQVNGVVRSLERLQDELAALGHEVEVFGPRQRRLLSFPMPGYPEITLDFGAHNDLAEILGRFRPAIIHVATEGPLGWTARRLARRWGLRFTTCWHTRFPDYLASRVPGFLAGIATKVSWAVLRYFHRPSSAVLVPTASLEKELAFHGFTHLRRWGRGVDTALFSPIHGRDSLDLPRPIFLCVGRVAVEKNLPAFLELDLPGSKVVVGDGPDIERLKARFPQAHFLGQKEGVELARCYAAADVFVFPSRTDTFGLVLLESLASGVPVAAFRVPGPEDVLAGSHGIACLHQDLRRAALAALDLAGQPETAARCREFAQQHSWKASAQVFWDHHALILQKPRKP
ncbi:MAG: glycosyltransferase family 1 protein [Alphaproteobacteria bacterium]|nr:MAG: glycosyltransferase family 1 protein [Alphaproteobacteria bacterium]